MDSLKDKTIVVTGSNGLIGVALLHALKENMSNIIAITLFVYAGIMSALCIGGCYYSIIRGLKENVTPQ